MAMTNFKIAWDIDSGPLQATHPEVDIDRMKRLYIDSAAQQWSHVVLGWPASPDGTPSELLIKVVFKELANAEEVARVDTAELLSHLVAGPNGESFPTQGTITIDLRDMKRLLNDQPRFKDTIVHEIGHVLGLGTLFEMAGMVSKAGGDYWYTGQYGCEAYAQLLGLPDGSQENVPLKKVDDGKSTPAFHWDEEALEKDIMSTLLDQPGVAGSSRRRPNDSPANRINVISIVSAGALKDLGYVVDLSKAMNTRAVRHPKAQVRQSPLATAT